MSRLRFIAVAAPVMVPALVYAAPTPAELSLLDRAVYPPVMSASVSALTYDFTGTAVVTDANGRSREQILMRGRATALGDKVRIDIDDAGSANAYMRGAYLLVYDGGRRVVWVNPNAKQYRETDAESMMGGLDALTNGSNGMIRMEATNVSIEAEKVGSGPTIQGHSTVHYRLKQRMDMKTKVLFKTLVTRDESTTDYYYATDIPNLVNPFLSSGPSVPRRGVLLSDDYTRQLRAAADKLYQGGAPLRTIVSAKSTDEAGRGRASVTTTEVTNVKRSDVSVALFEIPAGYSKTTLAPAGPSPLLGAPSAASMDGEGPVQMLPASDVLPADVAPALAPIASAIEAMARGLAAASGVHSGVQPHQPHGASV